MSEEDIEFKDEEILNTEEKNHEENSVGSTTGGTNGSVSGSIGRSISVSIGTGLTVYNGVCPKCSNRVVNGIVKDNETFCQYCRLSFTV